MRGNIYKMEDWKKNNSINLDALKEKYIEPEMSGEQFAKLQAVMKKAKAENRAERVRKQIVRYAVAAAAVVITFVILPNTSATVAHAMEQFPIIGRLVEAVTFRNYEYEDEHHKADIDVPELVVNIPESNSVQNDEVQEKLEETTNEINAEIQVITDELVEYFKKHVEGEMGYQETIVTGEVLATTEDYFTLKMSCYQGEASGFERNYYFTVDMRTGERLQLKDIFVEGADYITPISENIKAQMREQMDKDERVYYWLEDSIEELNFNVITDETAFYINEAGNVVIGFNEGDVAPMYMGAVEFEISAEVLSEIRK